MGKFKVGDRVFSVLRPDFGNGTIIGLSLEGYVIEFDKYIDGHSGFHSNGKNGHCWYFEKDSVELVDSENNDIDLTELLNIPEVEQVLFDKIEEPQKFNANKPVMSLVRPEYIKGIAEVLTYGMTKYSEPRGSEPNYMKAEGFNYSTIYDSTQRHLNAFWSGESIDPESGKNHLLHAASNLMFLYMYEISDKGIDDRYIIKEEK